MGHQHNLSHNPIYTDGADKSLLNVHDTSALAWRQRWFAASQLRMVLPPQSAYQIALGLETLALRLEHESASALALAEFLEQHPKVTRVNYPGLNSSAHHALAQKYLQHGYGAVMSFEVENPEQLAA